jgi:hypothetical protein
MKVKEFIKEKPVLALGEVTGHSHRIMEEVLIKKNNLNLTTEMILDNPVELVHEEHDTLMLPVGNAIVKIQQELDLLGEIRQVLD